MEQSHIKLNTLYAFLQFCITIFNELFNWREALPPNGHLKDCNVTAQGLDNQAGCRSIQRNIIIKKLQQFVTFSPPCRSKKKWTKKCPQAALSCIENYEAVTSVKFYDASGCQQNSDRQSLASVTEQRLLGLAFICRNIEIFIHLLNIF